MLARTYSPSRYHHPFLRVHVVASSSEHPLHKAYLISIVFSALAFFALALVLFFIVWYRKLLKRRRSKKTRPDGSSCKMRRFKYKELKKATKCFSHGEKLGKGGFGVVYRGLLADGREVAVKKLDQSSVQGEREFQNELCICRKLNSPHIVSLLGYCTHGKKERLLVYECMQNRSLQEALFDKGYHIHLDWDKRFKIILDIAKALEFLHLRCKPPIIHGDIKPSNVLLDSHFSARIADFGLAKFKTEDLGLDIAEVSSYAEYMKADKFRVCNSGNAALGTPDMNRSPTSTVFPSNPLYWATTESPSVTHKLLANAATDISPSESGAEMEDVMHAAAAFCIPPSLVQSAQSELCTHEVHIGLGGSNFGQETHSGGAIGVLKSKFANYGSNSCEMSGFVPCSKDFPSLQVNCQSLTKVHTVYASSHRQEAKGNLAGGEYLVEWSGSELSGSYSKHQEDQIVSANEKAMGGKEQDKSKPGEASTGIARKERREVGPTQRKSREWWKDEYFTELESKNKVNQESKSQRKISSSVDNWKDFLSLELSSCDESKKIDHKLALEVGRRRSNDLLRKARSGDLSWCRGRGRWTRTPSMAIGIVWSGDLNGEWVQRQWSGNLSRSGELASRDLSSSTSMRGTVCYVAPEYGGNGALSEKSDIYSFGVLMLVILSGRRPIQVTASPMEFERANLISWARCLSQSGRLLDLMDEGLEGKYGHTQATMCIMLALLCLQRVPTSRPDISEVVKILSGACSTATPSSLSTLSNNSIQ